MKSPSAPSGTPPARREFFWESINAIGVLQVPMLLAIWDDGYGISVPNELQIAKADISEHTGWIPAPR